MHECTAAAAPADATAAGHAAAAAAAAASRSSTRPGRRFGVLASCMQNDRSTLWPFAVPTATARGVTCLTKYLAQATQPPRYLPSPANRAEMIDEKQQNRAQMMFRPEFLARIFSARFCWFSQPAHGIHPSREGWLNCCTRSFYS